MSTAYKMPIESGWVALIEHQLKTKIPNSVVINASVPGDTTANGLQRLPRLLETYRPTIVIVELGGNDGLRGQPLLNIEKNLSALIEKIQQTDAKILLIGIQLPPNYGAQYTHGFAKIYPRLSEKYELALVPFLLDGVPLNADMLFEDGIHPRAAAQPMIAQTVWTYLAPLINVDVHESLANP